MQGALSAIRPIRFGRRNPVLSVVIPFYNEGANVEALFTRLFSVLDRCGLSFEVICVNDGSRDDTLARLVEARSRRREIKVIDFSRNFGKEIALSAGLVHASGQAVVPMDADLQHPPELIPGMIEKWREGFEVVYAVRQARTGQSLRARWFARAFYWVFEHLAEMPIPREAGDFRLLDRKVVDAVNAMPERSRFMKGIFAWVGFRQTGIPYEQEERKHGTSKWGFLKLLSFAFDGVAAFSNLPLRVWSVVGALVSGIAFVYIFFRIVRTLVYGIDVPGYESILAAVLFMGGMQLLTLGILGDYLGRVFNEVKGRPLFIVRDSYGFDEMDVANLEVGGRDIPGRDIPGRSRLVEAEAASLRQ